MPVPRLLITPGEPAGIGPDICVQIAQRPWPAQLVVVADPDLLQSRAKELGLPLTLCIAEKQREATHTPGTLNILPVKLAEPAVPGLLNPANAAYVIKTLEIATATCLAKHADAVVTGPVQKSILNLAGIPFTGHTEFFAHYCNVPFTLMLFVIDHIKVALATTHLPLAAVPAAITKTRLKAALTVLQNGLRHYFHVASPSILVSALNPHAGEQGHLGREEIDILIPLIDTLNTQGFHLTGPIPADTLFTPKQLTAGDAILAMYHDQALPIVKYIGMGRAVNVTLGLPFLRTSVDHGTALDIAGTQQADAGSLAAAIKLAIALQPTPVV